MAFTTKTLCLILVLAIVGHGLTEAYSLSYLYNSRVRLAERYERPLASSASIPSWISNALGLKHSGVVVTLQNEGHRYLVHKGDEYGRSSQTVVVDADFMRARNWKLTASKTIRRSRVADYVRAGGSHYNVLHDNCHDASRRMMRLN